MVLTRITFNEELPISIEQMKAYLVIETADFDDKIDACERAAIEFIEGQAGCICVPDEFRIEVAECDLVWSYGTMHIELPIAPIRSILAVKYFDEDGAEQEIAEADYRFERYASRGGAIRFNSSYSFPSLDSERAGAIVVELMAGFDIAGASGSGDDPALILPSAARAAMFMLSERFYQAGAIRAEEIDDLKDAVEALINSIRVIRK